MGLDMYLKGKKSVYRGLSDKKLAPEMEDGYEVKAKILDLGYWRKHPNLHGFIVNEFAEGKDECQEIELNETDLKRILMATLEDQLPETSGFFFGVSQPEDKAETVEIITKAIEWIKNKPEGIYESRDVIYRASW